MRLFIAVELDGAMRDALVELAGRANEELARRSPDAARAIKWVGENQLHLTLHFLGETEAARAEALAARLADPWVRSPFSVGFGRIGWFPSAGPPRVVWVDVVRGQADLVSMHDEIGRRLAGLGFTLEARKFQPHLTLGRVKRLINPASLDVLRHLACEAGEGRPIDHATLYRSVLKPDGPVYTSLARMNLAT